MKPIAIIAAVDEEVAAVAEIMCGKTEISGIGKKFISGSINGCRCILAQSGVGKVNAAATAQFIIDRFDPAAVINTGSAGSVSESLDYGDIVVSSACVQYDFDLTAFGREKGYITDIGKLIPADGHLADVMLTACSAEGGEFRLHKGIIASADRFVSSADEKRAIAEEFGALCCEMEGGAVAHICALNNVPFVIVRSISDTLGGNIAESWEKYLEFASARCARALCAAIPEI